VACFWDRRLESWLKISRRQFASTKLMPRYAAVSPITSPSHNHRHPYTSCDYKADQLKAGLALRVNINNLCYTDCFYSGTVRRRSLLRNDWQWRSFYSPQSCSVPWLKKSLSNASQSEEEPSILSYSEQIQSTPSFSHLRSLRFI